MDNIAQVTDLSEEIDRLQILIDLHSDNKLMQHQYEERQIRFTNQLINLLSNNSTGISRSKAILKHVILRYMNSHTESKKEVKIDLMDFLQKNIGC